MIHIDKFGIGNFRVFKEMQEFTFAPITILTGTNSSGKSSLTKAIMLLKESMLNYKLSKLDFNNSNLKLGSLEQNTNNENEDKNTIDFTITLTQFKTDSIKSKFIILDEYVDIYNKMDLTFINSNLGKATYTLNNQKIFAVAYTHFNNGNSKYNSWNILPKNIHFSEKLSLLFNELEQDLLEELKKNIIKKIQTNIILQDEYYQPNDFFEIYETVKQGIDSIGKGHYRTYDDEYGHHEYFEPESDNSKLSDFVSNELKDKLPIYILEIKLIELIDRVIFYEIEDNKILKAFKSVNYIQGVRLNQEIIFTFKEYPIFLKLVDSFNTFVKQKPILEFMGESSFLQKWLVEEFKIISKIEDLQFNIIDGFGVSVKINSERSLYQVGYGITQLLPIILQVALLENSVFIIEEPESNLHPALQSKLADFFIEASKTFNIQFIIETHSEYLIRKIQYLTAKKEIKPEDTQLYYFYPPNEVPEGEKQVYPINIQEDGSLSKNFGKGFFDEAGNLDLLLYQMTKTRNN